MSKKTSLKSVLKKAALTVVALTVCVVGFGVWFVSLLPRDENPQAFVETLPADLPYLKNAVKESRGKILAVVTSTDVMGQSGKNTGYELTELARAYYVFKANGFEVEIASPKGGLPPVVLDDDDMGPYDYAFLNDLEAQDKVRGSLALASVDGDKYQGIYFVGGKGAMFDFPQNPEIQQLVSRYYQEGKVVGAVCHGPAALVNVKLDDGSALLANKNVTSFTNDEELLLIKNAKQIFPFLLQDKLVSQGAKFQQGPTYLEQISHDGNLITGQNPWSVWALSEAMVKQLGYTPVPRQDTGEENSIDILNTYASKGYHQAQAQLKAMMTHQQQPVSRTLLAMHSIVAVMEWDIGKMVDMLGLVSKAKRLAEGER